MDMGASAIWFGYLSLICDSTKRNGMSCEERQKETKEKEKTGWHIQLLIGCVHIWIMSMVVSKLYPNYVSLLKVWRRNHWWGWCYYAAATGAHSAIDEELGGTHSTGDGGCLIKIIMSCRSTLIDLMREGICLRSPVHLIVFLQVARRTCGWWECQSLSIPITTHLTSVKFVLNLQKYRLEYLWLRSWSSRHVQHQVWWCPGPIINKLSLQLH